MTKELFQKANDLYKTMNSLEKVIKEREDDGHYITIYTPKYKDNLEFGYGFEMRFINKLKELKAEYEKEFEELE